MRLAELFTVSSSHTNSIIIFPQKHGRYPQTFVLEGTPAAKVGDFHQDHVLDRCSCLDAIQRQRLDLLTRICLGTMRLCTPDILEHNGKGPLLRRGRPQGSGNEA